MIIQLHSKDGSSSTFILRALITCSLNRPRVMQILKINSVKVCFVLTYISNKKKRKKNGATSLKGHWIVNVVIFTHPATCGHCRMEQKWCKGQHRHLQWRSFLAVVWGQVSDPSSLSSKSADQAPCLHSGTPYGKPWFLEHTKNTGAELWKSIQFEDLMVWRWKLLEMW